MIENVTHYLRHLGIKTEADLLAYATAQINKKRSKGYTELKMHDNNEPRYPRVDAGRWIVDCGMPLPNGGTCKAGCGVHRDWKLSACSVCGAVHRNLVWPDEHHDIETVLNERHDPIQRFWKPGETVADLVVENINHGVRKV